MGSPKITKAIGYDKK